MQVRLIWDSFFLKASIKTVTIWESTNSTSSVFLTSSVEVVRDQVEILTYILTAGKMSTFSTLRERSSRTSAEQMVLKCTTFTRLNQSVSVDHPFMIEQIYFSSCMDLIFKQWDVWLLYSTYQCLLTLTQAQFSIYKDQYWCCGLSNDNHTHTHTHHAADT